MSASRSRAGLLAASLGLWLLFPPAWLLAHFPAAGFPDISLWNRAAATRFR